MNRRISFFTAGRIFCCLLVSLLLLCGCGDKTAKAKTAQKAHVELRSEPEGAEIFANGGRIGSTPKNFSVKKGSYLLRFVKEGYAPQFVPLEITDNAPKRLDIRLQKASASALLDSTPSQAQVIVDGKNLGETPYILSGLPPGKHTVQMRKSGYAVRTVEFETKDSRPVKIHVNLLSNVGKLVIRTTPSRAKVIIDGKIVGVTPYQGKLSEGVVEYKLQLAGYGEVTGKETVTRGKTALVEKTLPILLSSLKVESTPSGATVWIGSTNYGKTPLTIRDLAPNQEHNVVLRLSGCGEESRKVSMPPGGTGTLLVHLSSDKGGIDLLAGPAGLAVYCDGKKVGVLQKSAGDGTAAAVLEIRNLLPGKHKISLAHSRGIPRRIDREVEVVKNKVVRLDAGTIWVPNAVIHYRDGQQATGYIYGESKENGYWFEDARYHSPDGGSVKGYIPYNKVRDVEYLPFGE